MLHKAIGLMWLKVVNWGDLWYKDNEGFIQTLREVTMLEDVLNCPSNVVTNCFPKVLEEKS